MKILICLLYITGSLFFLAGSVLLLIDTIKGKV